MGNHSEFFRMTVEGHPEPAGSKRAMPIYAGKAGAKTLVMRGKSPMIAVMDANPRSAQWKKDVAWVAKSIYREPPATGPLAVRMVFYRERPKGHTNSKGDLNKQGRSMPYPTPKPDVLKLARGVEDALTGIVWEDDAQIVEEHISKRYGIPERVVVLVSRFTE